MEDKISILPDHLWHNFERDVQSNELSQVLKISTRQVRKYVNQLNSMFENDNLIYSTNKGYRLNSDLYVIYKETVNKQKIETPKTRQNYIIQRLISEKEGLDIYELAEDIFVSESTINSDIRTLSKALSSFDLEIVKNKNIVTLLGTEKEKRKLMSSLISSDSYDNFILKNEIRLLTFHYHFWDFRKDLLEIFTRKNIFVNDYTLNNTALHLVVMIDRIRNNCMLCDDDDLSSLMHTPQFDVATEIKEYIQSKYQIKMNNSELYNLILIIDNNTTIIDYSLVSEANIHQYIEKKYIDIAHDLIHSVEDCYLLDSFSEDFICKFTIHVKNLFNRIENNYSTKNPLTAKIKATYPLIYDIAVFIAQQFKERYSVILSEDEIAFISFHIGSYFENNVQSKNKISILFLYADYYSIHKKTLDKISQKFNDKINIKYALSINNYNPNFVHADLIISTVELPFNLPSVIINPFLTEKDITKIQNKINKLIAEKNNRELKSTILDLFNEKLFYSNIHLNDKNRIIEKLCRNAIDNNFADDCFIDDVFAREKMSSTAFQNVAVPHSLGNNAKKSFISIALFQEPILWDNKEIQMVILIGVNNDTRKIFSQIFDGLIEVVTNSNCFTELIQSTDYAIFTDKLIKYIDEIEE
ncbi:MAG: PTS sugar transporter subunit IIA [Anaerorhabdus sp.]|uniref:BglG family transcription antiterminator n=1 Tax=Anaerorhabdus sp. TaxID=1872524 RepID=UPI002FC93BC7